MQASVDHIFRKKRGRTHRYRPYNGAAMRFSRCRGCAYVPAQDINCDLLSLLIAAVVPEPVTAQAVQALSDWDIQGIQLIAPLLIDYEVTATIRKVVYQQRLLPIDALPTLRMLLELDILLYHDDRLMERAIELAEQYNRPREYDTQYVALAERYNCPFWTADERLYNSLHTHLSWVHWIGNY